MPTTSRVVVFIDNSNVFKQLETLHRIDVQWCKLYNPKYLAEKLTGNRELVSIFFYCTPPPSFLQLKKPNEYWTQISYFEAVKKLNKVEVRYGRLAGGKDSLKEKNLDTKLTADMIKLAFENKYDVAVLVSNDGDYQSAVETVKELGKRVENAYFRKSMSLALRRACDLTRRLRRSYFRSFRDNLVLPEDAS